MRKESLELLRGLLNAPTPSGYEAPGQRIWCEYVRQFADEVRTDAYGNAVAILNPKGSPKIMIEAHADEIGLMVRYIDDKGFIYCQKIGGIDPAVIRGKRVNIHTAKGVVRGVIGATPIHLQDKAAEQKAPKLHESYIDIGSKDGEAAKKKVAVGDPITFVDEFEMLSDHVATARGFDDRAGAFAVAEALRLVSQGKCHAALYVCTSVQEEVGLMGAQMNVFNIQPDAAIAVDTTIATDTPGIDIKQHGDVKIGKGPTLTIGRENHPVLQERLKKVSREEKIDVQYETFSTTGGTDALAIYTKHGGIPTCLISIPSRYVHTTVETVDLDDLTAAAKLIAAFVLSLRKGDTFAVKV